MEGNNIVVNVDDVTLSEEQYTELLSSVRQTNENLEILNASVVHATMFLILLCLFQFYGLLRRALKKGGA